MSPLRQQITPLGTNCGQYWGDKRHKSPPVGRKRQLGPPLLSISWHLLLSFPKEQSRKERTPISADLSADPAVEPATQTQSQRPPRKWEEAGGVCGVSWGSMVISAPDHVLLPAPPRVSHTERDARPSCSRREMHRTSHGKAQCPAEALPAPLHLPQTLRRADLGGITNPGTLRWTPGGRTKKKSTGRHGKTAMGWSRSAAPSAQHT